MKTDPLKEYGRVEEIREIAQKLASHEPELYPEDVWDETLDLRIDRLNVDAGLPDDRKPYALAVKSGLYLWNENLEKSHALSQQIKNATGSYWHGIMHRMEGDYWNSKYWFRQVGRHPVFDALHADVRLLLQERLRTAPVGHSRLAAMLHRLAESRSWEPELFIDCVELQVGTARDGKAEPILKAIQRLELAALLEHSCARSFGGSLFHDG
jgi:hypothetical protein